METSSRLSALFQRWFKGQATLTETEELMSLLEKADPEHQLPLLLKSAWNDLQARPVYTVAKKDEMVDRILRLAAGETHL